MVVVMTNTVAATGNSAWKRFNLAVFAIVERYQLHMSILKKTKAASRTTSDEGWIVGIEFSDLTTRAIVPGADDTDHLT